MTSAPFVSIIVNNYNYARFLKKAVDSALRQTHRRTEVVVVDDGSTDDSHAVIDTFRDRIRAVMQDNRGQAAAFNAGIEASRGDIVIFLDADDTLLPFAAERAVEALCDNREDVVKAHWPLWEMSEDGKTTGRILPGYPLADGNLLPEILKSGIPAGWRHGLGHAWRRSLLNRVAPVQECGDKHGADAYLCAVAPVWGEIRCIQEPLGCYRTHETNFARGRQVRYRLERDVRRFPFLFKWIRHYLDQRGIAVDTKPWFEDGAPYAWTHAALGLYEEIEAMGISKESFILVDEGVFSDGSFPEARPMMEIDGEYGGPPGDDDAAIAELERQRRAGASRFVIAANCFWWFEHYCKFIAYLENHYVCIRRNGCLVAFDLLGCPSKESESDDGVKRDA
jgi:glycosyltransferase involved in cell wall biosynthesis